MLLALTLALSLAAEAPASPDFQEGQRLYFDLEYELAVFRFKAAARDDGMSKEQRALAHAWLGLAYAQIAEMESAKEAFADAVALDPDVALPKNALPPPKALQLLEAARAEAASQAASATEPSAATDAPTPPAPGGATTTTTEGAEGAPLGPLLLAGGGVAAALGVLALGAGATLGVIALSAADQGNAAAFQDDAAALKGDAEQSALAANVSYLLGGALVVIGAATLGAGFVVE